MTNPRIPEILNWTCSLFPESSETFIVGAAVFGDTAKIVSNFLQAVDREHGTNHENKEHHPRDEDERCL